MNLINCQYSSTYKAAVLKGASKPLVVEELSRQSLKKGEVRITVYSCGINSLDQWNVDGLTDANNNNTPVVPGYEVSGKILEIMEDDDNQRLDLKLGQRVVGMHPEFQGGFAQEMIISSKYVWPIPDSISYEIGATLVYSYTTALLALSRKTQVKEGDIVLITGAAGKLGLSAVDLAANVFQCRVIGYCNTKHEADVVRERGAFATIIEGKQDFVTEVKRVTNGNGVKLIIDPVGGEVFKEVIKSLDDDNAKIIVTGFASKIIPQVRADDLIENSYGVIGLSINQYRMKRYDVYCEYITRVIEMADKKLIKPYTSKCFRLDKVNDAFETLKNPKMIGKFVINMQ